MKALLLDPIYTQYPYTCTWLVKLISAEVAQDLANELFFSSAATEIISLFN